jgi:Flp pilus assembly protein TadG
MSFKQGQKGAAAIEFAVLLPLLALLVFGAIDFGDLFRHKYVLTNAAREGARAAVKGADQAGVELIIKTYISNAGLNSSRVTVQAVVYVPSPPSIGSKDKVTVTFSPYEFPVTFAILPTITELSAGAIMRHEVNS